MEAPYLPQVVAKFATLVSLNAATQTVRRTIESSADVEGRLLHFDTCFRRWGCREV